MSETRQNGASYLMTACRCQNRGKGALHATSRCPSDAKSEVARQDSNKLTEKWVAIFWEIDLWKWLMPRASAS